MTDAQFPAATAEQSRLVFHPNRYITAVMDDGRKYEMKPPTVEKLQVIIAAYSTAMATVTAPTPEGRPKQSDVARLYQQAGDTPSPYSAAFATTLEQCAGITVAAKDLPIWAGRSDLFAALYEHWRRLVIVVENAPADEAVETPPAGHGPVDDGAAQADASREGIPVFDLEAAAHAAAPTAPVHAGGIPAGRPGGAVLTPASGT